MIGTERQKLLLEIEAFIKSISQEITLDDDFVSYEKDAYDIVTSKDFEIEKALIQKIKKLDSEAEFLSEEFNPETKKEGNLWIIDPIDGTCNYNHGIALMGIQCAYYEDGEISMAVIHLPYQGETFSALEGGGAWFNGKRIKKVERPVDKCIVSFGDFIHNDNSLIELEHRIMINVATKVERIRMVGAASIDLAYSALGRFDGNFTFTDNAWDIFPGILVCKEAGLIINDASGAPFSKSSKTLAVFSTNALREACITC